MPIDLRSDTVTKPSAAMREAMALAEVGDDVFHDDPTINRLEARLAELLGKDEAVYVPSGTMGNQLCLRAHSQPGDSVIAHADSHILFYEAGAPCAISGLQPRTIATPDGRFAPEQIDGLIAPDDVHFSRNRLLSIENTHNRCGGAVWPLEQFKAVAQHGHELNLVVHLDGARLWNACAATGTQPTDWTAHVDSVSVCFSKGLGAPIGSALAGTREFVGRCRYFRKMFGGQMRQAGLLAAAVLYALEHNRHRIVEDHDNAKAFADLVSQAQGLSVVEPESNIVMIHVAEGVSAEQIVEEVHESDDVWVLALDPQRIRAVTHLDVSAEQCAAAGKAFQAAAEKLFGGSP